MEEVADPKEACLVWRARLPEAVKDPRAAAQLAREANGRGEHMLALSVAQRALRGLSLVSDPREATPLRQQMALALARSGSTEEAMEVLRDAMVASAEDSETLGLMGRLHKDLAESATKPAEAVRHREQALEFYARGFAADRSPYCGINTAVLAALTGDMRWAQQVAGHLLGLPPEEDRLWTVATMALVYMIIGQRDGARESLRLVGRLGRTRRSDLAVVRREVRRLVAALQEEAECYDTCFEPAAVAVYHSNELKMGDVEQSRLGRWIDENHVVCAWSAGASAGEGEFLQYAAALGVETCAVLPEAVPRPKCRTGVERASLVDFSGEGMTDRRAAEDLARRVATARAAARAASWDVPLLPLADGPVPAFWAGLPQEAFTLGEPQTLAPAAPAPDGGMRAVLCVWPSPRGTKRNGTAEVRATWESHPARCGAANGDGGPYFFGWSSMAEAGAAAAVLRQELEAGAAQAGCAYVLHASAQEQADRRLGDWAQRVYPGRLHATGRFADLAALESRRNFDLCYVGSIDCQAEPLGVRLYHLQPK
jgi:tetratricopeptide (TPR) repeat protein